MDTNLYLVVAVPRAQTPDARGNGPVGERLSVRERWTVRSVGSVQCLTATIEAAECRAIVGCTGSGFGSVRRTG